MRKIFAKRFYIHFVVRIMHELCIFCCNPNIRYVAHGYSIVFRALNLYLSLF